MSFCWRGWRTLMLAWLEELQLEVSIESTRLLRGPGGSPGFWAAHSVLYCSVYSIRGHNFLALIPVGEQSYANFGGWFCVRIAVWSSVRDSAIYKPCACFTREVVQDSFRVLC